MNPIAQYNCYIETQKVAYVSELEWQVVLYSPHPEMTIVIISDSDRIGNNRPLPRKIVDIANQIVKDFKLNPSQIVWIEHIPLNPDSASTGSFHLINFDWQAGQAMSADRSLIQEDWYLSWLETELPLKQPRS